MASIWAYRMNYQGDMYKWTDVPDKNKVECENILRTRYHWTDAQIETLKNPPAAPVA